MIDVLPKVKHTVTGIGGGTCVVFLDIEHMNETKKDVDVRVYQLGNEKHNDFSRLLFTTEFLVVEI